jgi:hypothetical protein
LTAGLLSVILGTASAAQNVGTLGALAVGCAVILRGRGGDPISHAAGSGVLTPGDREKKTQLAHDIDAGKVAPPGLAPTATTTTEAT